MAIKTFSVGEVLTASDTNTYLANSGLVYVTSTTIGSAVSSVTVSNCFSSTYDNYKVMISGGTSSAAGGDDDLILQLTVSGTASTANYNMTNPYWSWGSTTTFVRTGGGASFVYAGGIADSLYMNADLMLPFAAKYTTCSAFNIRNAVGGPTFGVHKVNTSYDGIKIAPSSGGTMTGGTITVYGYRKA